MNGDVGVGCIDEHALEIFDVPGDPARLMTIRPRHDDVVRVTLGQTWPFLVTEDVEIECIEGRKARGTRVGTRLSSCASCRCRRSCQQDDECDTQYCDLGDAQDR